MAFAYGQSNPARSLFQLSGKIIDATTGGPLPAASIAVRGTSNGVLSDKNGKYTLKLTSGPAHISCQYLGYKPVDTLLNISGDTQLDLYLKAASQSLSQVNVQATASAPKEIATQDLTVLRGNDLDRTRGLSLGDALKSITGVTTFQTGPSIAKPVIHGLTGSRVLILNNNVALQAQQWGQEHAPEI